MLGKQHSKKTKLKMAVSALKLPISIILDVIWEDLSRKKIAEKYGLSEGEVKCIRGNRNYKVLKYRLAI